MNEVFQTQPTPNLICMGKPPSNLILPPSQKNSKKTKEASIKGKKITPAVQVQFSNRDKTLPTGSS